MRDYLSEVRATIADLKSHDITPTREGVRKAIRADARKVGQVLRFLRESDELGPRRNLGEHRSRLDAVELRESVLGVSREILCQGGYPTLVLVAAVVPGRRDKISACLEQLRECGEIPAKPRFFRVRNRTIVLESLRPPPLVTPIHEDKMTFYEHVYSLDMERVERWRRIKARHLHACERRLV